MFDKDAGLEAYKNLEQSALLDLLKTKLDPIGDKALDAREKAQGRLEGLMQAIEVIKNAAFVAGRATGQADVLEQVTNEVRNRIAAIDEKYNKKQAEERGKSDGSLEQDKKASKEASRSSRPGHRKVRSS